jgi:hypothetical protein
LNKLLEIKLKVKYLRLLLSRTIKILIGSKNNFVPFQV